VIVEVQPPCQRIVFPFEFDEEIAHVGSMGLASPKSPDGHFFKPASEVSRCGPVRLRKAVFRSHGGS
jgi:hypothetical protein